MNGFHITLKSHPGISRRYGTPEPLRDPPQDPAGNGIPRPLTVLAAVPYSLSRSFSLQKFVMISLFFCRYCLLSMHSLVSLILVICLTFSHFPPITLYFPLIIVCTAHSICFPFLKILLQSVARLGFYMFFILLSTSCCTISFHRNLFALPPLSLSRLSLDSYPPALYAFQPLRWASIFPLRSPFSICKRASSHT